MSNEKVDRLKTIVESTWTRTIDDRLSISVKVQHRIRAEDKQSI